MCCSSNFHIKHIKVIFWCFCLNFFCLFMPLAIKIHCLLYITINGFKVLVSTKTVVLILYFICFFRFFPLILAVIFKAPFKKLSGAKFYGRCWWLVSWSNFSTGYAVLLQQSIITLPKTAIKI